LSELLLNFFLKVQISEGQSVPGLGKGHCFKLAVFRCLSAKARKNTERSKGRITNQDNSGTVGDGNGLSKTEGDRVVDGSGVDAGPVGAWVLGDERKGMKVTDPKLKSFL
jgi:hypothetical protein